MAAINITQIEADALIQMEKHCLEEKEYEYLFPGEKLIIPLKSSNGREQFLLDINRKKIDIKKGNYQNRARQAVVLLRLDFGGPRHQNPDGEIIPSPHLHVYKERYGDKWAYPLSSEHFPRIDDLWGTLDDFMTFCNITRPPIIRRGIFE